MKVSKNEYTMQTLASLAGKVIAKRLGLSKIQGFDALMNSKTGELLFDDSLIFWQNGPDYIANEYFLEKNQN